MIETPFGNIHGIEDETLTSLDLLNIFKAIENGKIKRIVYHDNVCPYKQRAFDVSKIIHCKDCKKREDPLNCKLASEGIKTDDEWYCADGKEEEGKSE